jgi:hypothetical protein
MPLPLFRGFLILLGAGLLALGTWEFNLATDATASGDTVGLAIWIWVAGGTALSAGVAGPRSRWWAWLLVVAGLTLAVVIWAILYAFSQIE